MTFPFTSSTNKINHHDITEIVLKVVLNTITITITNIEGEGQSFEIRCASSTNKTGHHDIAEILLKVALNTRNQIKSNHTFHIMT
jgi:hypothetical protein